MAMTEEARAALEALEVRILTILPEEYHDSYDTAQPVPMRSAGLKYGMDGKVAWDEIWGSFCDLAMAGGPPHKGTLLEPATRADIEAQPWQYKQVVEEICRGITMSTDLAAGPSPRAGWVRVPCLSDTMTGWLVRAITMENVAVRCDGHSLDLPAAPHYRVEKEIKNVVTVMAKTCHYWLGHMPEAQQEAITDLFAEMATESPLIVPAIVDGDVADRGPGIAPGDADAAEAADAVHAADDRRDIGHHAPLSARIADAIHANTGLPRVPRAADRYAGWLGVTCPDVRSAIWMMRALVVSNVLSRREGTVLFVPVDPLQDPTGDLVARAVTRMHRLAVARDLL